MPERIFIAYLIVGIVFFGLIALAVWVRRTRAEARRYKGAYMDIHTTQPTANDHTL